MFFLVAFAAIVLAWFWLRGNAFAAFVVFWVIFFLGGPGGHTDWNWSTDWWIPAVMAAIAVAPRAFWYGLSRWMNSRWLAQRLINRSLAAAGDRPYQEPNKAPALLSGLTVVAGLAVFLVLTKLHHQW